MITSTHTRGDKVQRPSNPAITGTVIDTAGDQARVIWDTTLHMTVTPMSAIAPAAKRRASRRIPITCLECGHRFSRAIGPRTFEIRCPKCHGYDTDLR